MPGPPDPHGAGLAASACLVSGLWDLRAGRVATALPYGQSPTHCVECLASYARLCKLIEQYSDRPHDPGRFARRLLLQLLAVGLSVTTLRLADNHLS